LFFHTAHRFYELCNEMGLMVCDEANIETHGFALLQQMSYLTCHPSWKNAFQDRINTMCCRARNYPCIVTWSLGNESVRCEKKYFVISKVF